ncbi:hypothetical protein [Roseiarcus sp.]|uniref:hypothetical protein n=1 Tax=Roseiarcus sp. TaxID=1969460 RepID=UPI003F95C1A0
MARISSTLRRLFASELTGASAEITPMRQLKIDAAAQAVALAETARSRFLREGKGDVADLVAVQRNADAAVRRIGLPPDKPAAPATGVSAPDMARPSRIPTIAEVTAEQVRRAVAPAIEAAAPALGPGPDLTGLSDDELAAR